MEILEEKNIITTSKDQGDKLRTEQSAKQKTNELEDRIVENIQTEEQRNKCIRKAKTNKQNQANKKKSKNPHKRHVGHGENASCKCIGISEAEEDNIAIF